MSSTLEKIQANEAAVGQLANSNVEISRRIMAIDQAQLSISKTLAAVSEVLIEKGVISDVDVMDKLRDAEDKSSERQVDRLIEAGMLAEIEVADKDSVVVLKQSTGEKVVANYYIIELQSQLTAEAMRDAIIGLKVGEAFDFESAPEATIKCEVIKILENKSLSKGE